MRYSNGDIVLVSENRVPKEIEFSENICEVNIYYMTDKTSYAEHQIVGCASDKDLSTFLVNEFLRNKIEIFPKDVKDSMLEWCKKNIK